MLYQTRKGRQYMYILIKNGRNVTDGWRTLTLAEKETPDSVSLPVGPILVPLSVWRARRTELIYREYEHGWPLGVWLAAEESIESIERDIHDFALIAVLVDPSADSKDAPAASLLLDRYGYTGELRAIVDLPRERLAVQKQVGFDAYTGSGLKNFNWIGPSLSGRYDFNSDNPSKRFAAAG